MLRDAHPSYLMSHLPQEIRGLQNSGYLTLLILKTKFLSYLIDVEFFAESLARYTRQEKIAQLIDTKKPLGLLMIDASDTKAKLEPSPRR